MCVFVCAFLCDAVWSMCCFVMYCVFCVIGLFSAFVCLGCDAWCDVVCSAFVCVVVCVCLCLLLVIECVCQCVHSCVMLYDVCVFVRFIMCVCCELWFDAVWVSLCVYVFCVLCKCVCGLCLRFNVFVSGCVNAFVCFVCDVLCAFAMCAFVFVCVFVF